MTVSYYTKNGAKVNGGILGRPPLQKSIFMALLKYIRLLMELFVA